ncbi:cytochrome P450 [Rhodocollybia butyracea]|uniref:Cytochrome P450 n=1 Tax=Rhodocollybia butyracea TaxID=206335 RepID=A0A9P5Q674_9AGAR|nr:cytochrome P450 [Rhodocollybia butyracea]
MDPLKPWTLVAAAIAIYALKKYLELRLLLQSIQYHPGNRLLLPINTLVTMILPRIPAFTRGITRTWTDKYEPYAKCGWDVIADVSILPSPSTTLFLADPVAIKEVFTSRARFPKPTKTYKTISFFGDNIIASEGEEWKRYRKVAAPAFNDRNSQLIWDETARIMLDLFENVWGSQDSVTVDHAVDITVPIALFVIGAAAFGNRISWKDDDSVPPGHQLSFKDAIHEVSMGTLTKTIVPKWAMGWNSYTRKVRLAFDELDAHMLEMIGKRRSSEKKEDRYDLLSNLLDASSDDTTFTDRDLTGNIFIFLIAGHETTAHALCFALALLALHPTEQETLFQHINSVLSDGRIPTYQEMPLFTHTMAVLYETLRMFPSVNAIPKYSAEDTTLTISNAAGEKRTLPVPKGSVLVLNAVGLHYNPHYWKDPETFQPTRFLGNWPRDAFLPFSSGPRACLGRKFFETEAVAILTLLVSRYKIEVKDEPQFARETFEERKARVLASNPGITMTPIRVPLVFKRR